MWIGNLNIKLLANKFDQLKENVRKCLDTLTNNFDQLKGIVRKCLDTLTNKFDQLKENVRKCLDIFIITEIKLMTLFKINCFYFMGFPNHFQTKVGGATIYACEDISSKLLKVH